MQKSSDEIVPTEQFNHAGPERTNYLLRLRIFFWFLAIVIGAIHAWVAAISFSMNADGINYLDMGDAYLRSDWSMAINAYWSPFYSWLLGLAMRILDPSMRWEFPVVHMVNFIIYLGALCCFEFFWGQLMRYRIDKLNDVAGDGSTTLPNWAFLALGYTLFIWSSLNLINIWAVTPDMCVASFVYLAAGLIVRIRMGAANWHSFVLLGMVLGLSYLAKAVMFLLSFAFLLVSMFSAGSLRRAVPNVLMALTIFLLIGGPFIAALSSAKGRLTFGDSGKLMYAWFVNDIPLFHWQGQVYGDGTPKHPTRKIFDDPPIFEFAMPIGGTYPVSFDPSYWYDGVKPHFDLRQQVRVLLSSARFYFDLFFRTQGGLIVSVVILYLMMKPNRFRVMHVLQHGGLTIIAIIALGMYALVHVQSRYIGAFIVLFWADLLAAVRLPYSPELKKLVSIASISMLIFLIINISAFNLEGLNALMFNVDAFGGSKKTGQQGQTVHQPARPTDVVQALRRLGVQPGDKVAVIGYAVDSFWARLARVKVVAEMFGWKADSFWFGDISLKSKVLKAFASTGAKAIVAESVPSNISLVDWYRIGETSYYIHIF
jgi:hypothetical protein